VSSLLLSSGHDWLPGRAAGESEIVWRLCRLPAWAGVESLWFVDGGSVEISVVLVGVQERVALADLCNKCSRSKIGFSMMFVGGGEREGGLSLGLAWLYKVR
jgi:hypothetical protein